MARSDGGHPGKVPMDRLGPGAVLLKPPDQGPPPRTSHLIVLQGCSAGMYVILDEENKCIGYKLVILDPGESKRYEFEFGDDVRQQWETEIGEWPIVGEVPRQIQEALEKQREIESAGSQ